MKLAGYVTAKILTTRSLVRAPIALYRRGWGRLMGSRMLMLQHTGRPSGLARYVVLEVVDRPSEDVIVIASGFGRGSQWYRNLAADPTCRVSTGRLRDVPAHARLMDDAESAQVLSTYAARYPRSWENLQSAIEQALGRPVTQMPMVELRLQLDAGDGRQ